MSSDDEGFAIDGGSVVNGAGGAVCVITGGGEALPDLSWRHQEQQWRDATWTERWRGDLRRRELRRLTVEAEGQSPVY